jgi:hypothetical protein
VVAKLPRCLVGMEACATAHYGAREHQQLGHEVRLTPPPMPRQRNKNDPADAAQFARRSAARRHEGTGGKVWLGPISKRGNGYLRRLRVNGATAVLKSPRAKEDPWLANLHANKPRKLVAVASADKMARIGGQLMTRQRSSATGRQRRKPPTGRLPKLARVNRRDGNVGQSGDRGQPAAVIGALRPRQLQHRYMQVEVMAELAAATSASDPRQISCAA